MKKKISLKPEQLFQVKVFAKNGFRPAFYWNVDSFDGYTAEVIVLCMSLLRKRAITYFGFKNEGMDFDLEMNPIEDRIQNWIKDVNDWNEKGIRDKGWDLFVNALHNSVANQNLISWVGSDKGFLDSIQSVWNSIFVK